MKLQITHGYVFMAMDGSGELRLRVVLCGLQSVKDNQNEQNRAENLFIARSLGTPKKKTVFKCSLWFVRTIASTARAQ